MANYHLEMKIIGRGGSCKCNSSTAASAYRSASRIFDERTQTQYDYTKKEGVVYSEIIKPEHVPEWANDREKLWNEVEKIEKSSNSQLAREIELSLPKELEREKHIELVREYIKDNFVNRGMVADFSIHDKGDGNPHSHIMLTMRQFNQDGTWGAKAKKEYILDKDGNKTYDKNGNAKSRKINSTDWDNRDNAEKWRANWAEKTNEYLRKCGYDKEHFIDHRSYERQGIDKIPTKHMGAKAHYLENKKGIKTEIGELNRAIEKFNKEKIVELEKYKELKKQLEEAKEKLSVKYKFKNIDDAMYFKIKNTYRKQHPEARYLTTNGAMAIHNLNKHLGKTTTIKAIYEMYSLLLKSVELDRKLIADIQKTLDVKNIKAELQKNQERKFELQKGILGKVKNKAEIEQLTKVIEGLENKLNNTGINPDGIEKRIQDLKEAKIKNDKSVETYKKVSEAKKEIDESGRRRAERKAYFKNKYKKQQREDERERKSGYSR